MKYALSFILLFIVSTYSFGQTIYFDSISKVKKRMYTYHKVDGKKLKLDFYQPKKIKNNYPLIVYVHGGGFSGGRRNENYIKDFANFLTKRGYAVASISYRLTMKRKGFGCQTEAKDKISAFQNAAEDIGFAFQYILRKKRRFKIDTNKIILAGSSAGAEAVLHFAYVDKKSFLAQNYQLSGIISMAGALTTLDNINKKTAVPTQFFHGTSDKLVPYVTAPHHYCDKNDKGYLPLFGSKAIANHLKSLEKSYYLYSIENGDHSWNSRPMYQCRNEILDFLFYDVLKQKNRQTNIYRKTTK